MSDCRQNVDKLFGIYRGKVVKHLENGVLKVYVPDVYPMEWASTPDKLPDAEMVVPLFGGNCNGNGVFSYPNVGAYVICQFLNGDQNLPIVIGATQGGSLASMKYSEVANELDPVTGKEPACIHMVCVGKSKIKVYEGGTIEMQVNGKDGKSSKLVLDQNGNILADCDGMFQVKAQNIKMMAKNQMVDVAGAQLMLIGSKMVTLHSKDIAAMSPEGVVTVTTKHRITEF